MISINGVQGAVDLLGSYKSQSIAGSTASAAMAEHIKDVMVSQFLSGQAIGVESGALRTSWTVRRFETPQPGATLSTPLPYARLQNYGLPGRLKPRRFLNGAIDRARPNLHTVALQAWRLAVAR